MRVCGVIVLGLSRGLAETPGREHEINEPSGRVHRLLNDMSEGHCDGLSGVNTEV